MPKDGSPNIPESSSSSIHMSMITPGVLGVKIIGRLDSMSTGTIWRQTNLDPASVICLNCGSAWKKPAAN